MIFKMCLGQGLFDGSLQNWNSVPNEAPPPHFFFNFYLDFLFIYFQNLYPTFHNPKVTPIWLTEVIRQ